MHDDQLRGLLRALEDDRHPHPAFADALYERLLLVSRHQRRRRAPLILLAAALLGLLVAGVAIGSNLMRLPEVVDVHPTASAVASAPPIQSPVPSASAEPNASVAPSASAAPALAGRVLASTADGLRTRSEASTSAGVIASVNAGQRMGIVGGRLNAEGMTWYEVRIGPGEATGWVASGPDGDWLRLVDDGAVAYARHSEGRNSVALVTPLGDHAIVTLQEGAFLRDWTWSPDGSRLAGTTGDTGDSLDAVAVMESDGDVIRRYEGAVGPAWSPDGQQLAWVDFEGRIVITDEALEPAAVLDGGRSPHALAWSPDGSRLAYLAVDCDACPTDEPILGDPPIAIFTIGIDGSDRRQLTSSSIDGLPSWSADGTRIAFLRFDLSGEFPTRMMVVDADGGEPSELVDGAAIMGGAAWSPDGSRLALATTTGILVAASDGSSDQVVALPDPDTFVSELQWSPSGRYLLYGTSTASSETTLWIVEASGAGEPQPISPSGEGATQARWQPILVALP